METSQRLTTLKKASEKPRLFSLPEKQKSRKRKNRIRRFMVWVTGFEPAIPRPPVLCATELRHTQKYKYNTIIFGIWQRVEALFVKEISAFSQAAALPRGGAQGTAMLFKMTDGKTSGNF